MNFQMVVMKIKIGWSLITILANELLKHPKNIFFCNRSENSNEPPTSSQGLIQQGAKASHFTIIIYFMMLMEVQGIEHHKFSFHHLLAYCFAHLRNKIQPAIITFMMYVALWNTTCCSCTLSFASYCLYFSHLHFLTMFYWFWKHHFFTGNMQRNSFPLILPKPWVLKIPNQAQHNLQFQNFLKIKQYNGDLIQVIIWLSSKFTLTVLSIYHLH